MNSASENDLQKAIDDIARANKAQDAPASDAAQAVAASVGAAAPAAAPAGTSYIETDGQVPSAPAAASPIPPPPAPPVPPVPAAPAAEPAVSAPAAQTEETAVNDVAAAVAAATGVEEPEAADDSDEAEGEPKTDYGKMEADAVRETAIEELKPLIGTVDLTPMLGKMEMLPETKFKIFKNIIEATSDKDVLGLAYATAKEIVNDTDRAEALLYIVEMVDKLV